MPANPLPETQPAPDAPAAGESEVARRRRDQVVEAAMDVIATQGLHRLSLSQIEERTGMKRGHLTYYFPNKEDILLAVFDRMLGRIIEQAVQAGGPVPNTGRAWDCTRFALGRHLRPDDAGQDPDRRAFGSLLHTFLAQINYRDDYRAKLAGANGGWRDFIAADLAGSIPDPPTPPRVLASIVMALIQGLSQQLAVDPAAFDRPQMFAALSQMLAPLFRADPAPPPRDEA